MEEIETGMNNSLQIIDKEEEEEKVYLDDTLVAEADQAFVLEREPWVLDKSPLVLMKIEDYGIDDHQNFKFFSVWIQLFNISLCNMTALIVRFVSKKIGTCLEVESDNEGRCWGHFARSRIRYNLHKPLKRRIKVRPD
ncbi:hypothetical protein TorRG33x02_201460 [Trema orientale]|uniref:Uncharacterized protein n=1 Tax=Trema orientale TaxID=63057 RepID=A0A2P5EET5_TREOI|nr:hypothetical protein TorRG33x02_201460 [Trema orientale]